MIFPHSLSAATTGNQRPFLAGEVAAEVGACPLEPNPWPLVRGGYLHDVSVRWEISGAQNAPVIAVLGGISADRHVTSNQLDSSAGWWNNLVGPGRALDTDRFRVLGIDFVVGSLRPGSSRPFDRPAIDTRDQARALLVALEAAGDTKLRAIVGSSYGGMVALAAASEYSEQVEQIVVVSAAHRPHPQSTAWRSVQRRIVRLGIRSGDVERAMAISRALAMVTYRSPIELEARFSGSAIPAASGSTGYQFPVEGYLRARGADFASHFEPSTFLALSESIDLQEVDPASIEIPATLVAVSSDQLIPTADMEKLAEELTGPCRFERLDSIFGHDAFLKETTALDAILRRALAEEVVV